ncbi:ATP-binding protein [Candidatus Kaiserbacteria bacterium]|nr:ATP-binding protein [Candidatus Kaiserbacteria bacterium]
MRGVPGSGKSTIARRLAGENGVIHSTDDYFMVDGEYRFDPEKLREHHDANHKAFCESVIAGFEVVICDNTNTQPWHFKRYVESAEKAGYMVPSCSNQMS